MCEVCGCGEGATAILTPLGKADPHEHVHADGTRHSHPHGTAHAHGAGRLAPPSAPAPLHVLETRLVAKNDALARRNRDWLAERKVVAVNLMGAPGAGKTAVLERTIRERAGGAPLLVIEGDQATTRDGERIRAAGASVVQLNTGTGCHLDADMVADALRTLDPPAGATVVVENVGNLVCPALFDLGEQRRVVVLSVAEGDDKPLKYPDMFRAADAVLINKVDLLPHVDFDVAGAVAHARALNPRVTVFEVSARTGAGFAAWQGWLATLTS